jgi:hypothetical protein
VYSWLAAQCQLNYRQMKNVCCIEDLRRLAHRKVPRAIFDYAAAGSYSQQTLLANVADLARINLRQRVMIDVSTRDVSTTMLGGRDDRLAARQRRDPRLSRCTEGRHSVHDKHAVDLFD